MPDDGRTETSSNVCVHVKKTVVLDWNTQRCEIICPENTKPNVLHLNRYPFYKVVHKNAACSVCIYIYIYSGYRFPTSSKQILQLTSEIQFSNSGDYIDSFLLGYDAV